MGFGANNLAAPRADTTVALKEIGDKVIGTVVFVGDWYEHTNNFGKTATQCKVVLDVDGTLQNLYVERDGPMAEAIADAIRRVDRNAELEEGCVLGVKHHATKPTTKGNPLRLYTATFEKAPPKAQATGGNDYADEEPF